MIEELSHALAEMEFQEGTVAVSTLVWAAIRDSMDDKTRAKSNRLSVSLKAAQKRRGVQNPSCGELMAAEILAKIGMLLIEKEG